ncbi:MAG: TatD family hydrolase [Treponema sp.]|nr:TatD family hydrolase [Treponema sp.]
MYSDTHFHFQKLTGDDASRGAEILDEIADYKPVFMLDVGVRCDDLEGRLEHMAQSLDGIENPEKRARSQKFMHFSAGIWPDVEEIENRWSCLETLEEQIQDATASGGRFAKKIAAIGECGIDHHWNPGNPDARDRADFNPAVYEGERELFVMQLILAKKMRLPVIVHSRDAFDDTLECIKSVGYHNGIIHCYSYGIDEARKFVDLGWHLAFGGAVTYTKKDHLYEMEELLRYVPDDRLLLETDAPYLAPVPLRGEPNVPQNIRYTYEFISAKRNITMQQLCRIVDKNCEKLFRL